MNLNSEFSLQDESGREGECARGKEGSGANNLPIDGSVRETATPLYLKVIHSKLDRPSFRAIFDLVANDPHLREARRELYQRRREILSSTIDPDGMEEAAASPYRRVMMLILSLCVAAADKRFSPLLEHAIDYESRRESDALKSILFSSANRPLTHPVALVGAGIHAAAFNSTFLHCDPLEMPITFERRQRLGGQFRSYSGPVIRLNSTSGPIRADRDATIDIADFNSLGSHAPIRVSHISGALYPDNAELGLVAALNQYLCGSTILGAEVLPSNQVDRDGLKVLRIRDVSSGAEAQLCVGKMVILTGLGSDRVGFRAPDEATQAALASNQKLPSGEKFYYTYQELLTLFGGGIESAAQRLFAGKRVIIQGSGHSALTVIELLTGLGPTRGTRSSNSVGRPAAITVIGSQHLTAQSFQEEEFSRYVQVAALFPRAEDDRGALIEPIVGRYAYQLRVEPEAIRVLHGPKHATAPDSEVVGDILISTTGFEPEAEKIIPLPKDARLVFSCRAEHSSSSERVVIRCQPELMPKYAEHALSVSGCVFTCDDGTSYRLEPSEGGTVLFCFECSAEGVSEEGNIKQLSHDAALMLLLKERPPVDILYPTWSGAMRDLPPKFGENGAVVARFGLCPNVFIAGPASAPTVQTDDQDRIDSLGSPGNSVSISVTIGDTCYLAQQIAREHRFDLTTAELSSSNIDTLDLPASSDGNITGADARELVCLAVLRVAHIHKRIQIHDGLRVKLTLQKSGQYAIDSSRRLTESERGYLADILADPAMRQVMQRRVPEISCPLSRATIARSLQGVFV
jgi:hypothetical protein